MKIYFAGSIRGGRDDTELYHGIINYLKKYGEVLTEHVGDKKLQITGEQSLTEKQIHDRDLDWLLSADLVVGEVTQPSLGVGYEIGRALEHGKKILCLHRPTERKLSAMILGSIRLTTKPYKTLNQAEKIIDIYMKEVMSHN